MNFEDFSSLFKHWKENASLANKAKTEFEQRNMRVADELLSRGVSADIATGKKTTKALRDSGFDSVGNKLAELIAGGEKGMSRSEGKKPSEVDPKELAAGIKIEREHSDNPKVQKEIAMDHLTEHPKYYTGLKKMEAELTKAEKVMNKVSAKTHPKDCDCEECKESKKEKKEESREKTAKKLTTKAREHISKKNFAEPEKKNKKNPAGRGAYPIPDANHARNALARVAQFGSSAEKAEVRRKVHSKYPNIGKDKK